MITRQPSRPGRYPVGWALALLAGLLAALLPLAAAAAPAREAPAGGSALDAPARDTAPGFPPAARPLLGILSARAAAPDAALPTSTLAVPAGEPAALLGGPPAPRGAAPQQTDDQATLETRRPEVQWAAGDSGAWQSVPTQQTVQTGDRVRTGSDASARLVYFEGTSVDLGPETGIRVERLARSDGGNVVTRLFQAAGTTVSRVVHLTDPAASFEIDTPSATAFVRGTEPRVEVAADGSTRVTNVPDGTEGLVVVVGKDQNASQVTLRPGEGTSIVPGLPPSLPAPVAGLQVDQTAASPAGQTVQEQQQERHRQQQQQAQQAAEQARLGVIAAQNELSRLTQQENALLQQIADLLTPTPAPTPRPKGVGPSNDQFAGATPVTSLPARFQQNTSGATTEGGEPLTPCGPNTFTGKTVWFAVSGSPTGGVSVDTFGSDFDTVLAVYTGTTLGSLSLVACNDDTSGPQSRVVFAITPGTTYYVQVGGNGGSSGNLVVNVRAAPPPPPNDAFAHAIPVTVPATRTAVTDSASTEPGEPTLPICDGRPRPIGATVWYTLTPATTAAVAVDTLGSSFDTMVAVYTGSALANLSLVRCNDDTGGTLQSRVSFVARAGTTYYVQVGGFANASGNLTVHFSPGLPPPPNDDFANAAPIGTLPAQLSAVTDSASVEPGEPISFTCDGRSVTIDNTVWYTLTPLTTGYVAVDTFGSDYNTVLAVYIGSALASLTPVACNDDTLQSGTGNADQSRVTFNAVAGTTYRIQVGGYQGASGNLVLHAAVTSPPPANDNFAAATVVAPASLPATFTAATDSATVEPGEPHALGSTALTCAGTSSLVLTNTVWYSFTPTSSGALVVDTFGSSYDTAIVVYTGSALGALSQVACNDDATQPGTANTLQSRVVADVTAGTTYRVQIGGVQGAFGSLTVHFAFGPPPPPNDAFANAQAVTTLPSNFGPVDTTTASLEPGEPTAPILCAVPIGNTVWYTFTPATTVPVSIDTFGSNFDTVLAVYANNTGAPPASLLSSFFNQPNQVACNDDANGTPQSRVTFLATGGKTYYVQVGGFNGAFGTLQVHFQPATPPPNDNFANAQAAAPGQFTASTVAATTEPGEPLVVDAACAPTTGGTLGATVWYTYTTPIPAQVTIDTFGSDFDTVLAVYTGNALGSLSRVACNDDAQGTQSQLTFAATPGTTYRVQVGGFGGAVGNLVVNFSQSPGPGVPRVQPPAAPAKAPPAPPPADKLSPPAKPPAPPGRGR
ncbi:MAG TPA: FecR family protein [Chloroflexota bacterium]|nr:FecR family protein [Chloroflexota bacterium]